VYFPRLAARVVQGLVAASFPPCPGGYMATGWTHPLAEWERLFRGFVERPEPAALMQALNFLDFRGVDGRLDLAPLDAVVRGAAHEPRFLAHLARASIGLEPPLGAFRTLRRQEGGVDLKKGGLVPIVSLARLAGIEAGSLARPTLARLTAAAEAGTITREGAATLGEAFRFLMALRLREQLRAVREGRPVEDRVAIESLSPLERRHLKDVFVAVHEMQEAVRERHATDRLG
jgi:CBS domain-containing protein